MARKRKKQSNLADAHPDWTVSTEIQINGRNVTKDTELSITGERGRFRFMKHIQTPEVEWIDVVGGPSGYKTVRSFRPEKVRTVHRKNRTPENKPKEDKQTNRQH